MEIWKDDVMAVVSESLTTPSGDTPVAFHLNSYAITSGAHHGVS
jgi:hypothetical protein